jgi:hypothetical protein
MAKHNWSRSLAVTEIRPARFSSPHRRGQIPGGEAGSRPPGLGVTRHHSLDEAGGAVPGAELHAGWIAATAGRELSALHSACVIRAVGSHVIILADRRTAPHPVHRVPSPAGSSQSSPRPRRAMQRPTAQCALLAVLGESREPLEPEGSLLSARYLAARAKTTPREVACRV